MKTTAFILSLIAAAGVLPSVASDRHARSDRNAWAEIESTVYIAETCPMPSIARRKAQETAAVLFEHIGVHLRFTTVRPVLDDPGIITLHVWSRAPKDAAPHVVGTAHIAPGRPHQAFVFYDRILEFYPPVHDSDTGILLGYAIAHELGHILRAAPGHSMDGVMKARWRRKDILPMLQHAVHFSTADAQRIRAVQALRRTAPTSVETN